MTYDVEVGNGGATLWVRLHSWDFSDQVFPQKVTNGFPQTDPEEWPVSWSTPMLGVHFADEAVLAKLHEFCAKLKEWPFDSDKTAQSDDLETTDLGEQFNDLFDEFQHTGHDQEAITMLQEMIDFIDKNKEARQKEAGWNQR